MKKVLAVVVVLAAILVAVLARPSRPSPAGAGEVVRRGPFSVWSVYDGKLEARHVETVMSGYHGAATIIEIVPEGTRVAKGDVVVRFDESQVERDLLRLQRDASLAASELQSLAQAELPIEIRELEMRLVEVRDQRETEQQYLKDSADLVKDKLISERELEQQAVKVQRLDSTLRQLEDRLRLTREFMHPSKLTRARANLEAAQQELALMRERRNALTIAAPVDGMVVYQPLNIGSEYRTARVGDTVYQNQPFITIPDMRDLVVNSFVPEAELSRVVVGNTSIVFPLAYPDLKLRGQVEAVGSMAQSMPDRPGWQRFFRVLVAVREADPRLRSGMSVQASFLSYENTNAVTVSRRYVWWEDGTPRALVRGHRGPSTRSLTLGMASHAQYEVLGGLEPGETVLPHE